MRIQTIYAAGNRAASAGTGTDGAAATTAALRYAVASAAPRASLRIVAAMEGNVTLPIWFWGWLVTAGAFAVVALVTRDRYTPPWVFGSLAASLLAALRVSPIWMWVAFLGVSAVLFVVLNRERYLPKHRATRKKKA